MLKEMVDGARIAKDGYKACKEFAKENPEVLAGAGKAAKYVVKVVKAIPNPVLAVGAVAVAAGGVYVVNKIKDRKEEEMKEQIKAEIMEEIIAEQEEKAKMEEEINRRVAEKIAELNK